MLPSNGFAGRFLGHDQFFGLRRGHWNIRGFAIASMRADPALEIETHTHETAHLIVLLDGQYVTSARSADAICTRPAVIYNPPGTTHRDKFRRVDGTVSGSFVSIAVSAGRYAEMESALSFCAESLYANHRTAMSLAMRLAKETQHWNASSPLAAEAICLELMGSFAEDDATDRTQARPAWLRVARELLHECCVEGTTINEIARACDVHPVYLARTFRRFFGYSPGDYLRKCRVQRAAAMLSGTRTPLAAVALECGYSDQSHFSNAFRTEFAVTPGEYRRRLLD
ncbi:MAG: helix-turn-helix transcriptional regulator [Gemmatimonadaceae bacterium]